MKTKRRNLPKVPPLIGLHASPNPRQRTSPLDTVSLRWLFRFRALSDSGKESDELKIVSRGVSETVSESTDRVAKNSGELDRIILDFHR